MSFLNCVAPPLSCGVEDIVGTGKWIKSVNVKQPLVFVVLFRSKNKNCVVYEANRTADGLKWANPPVTSYWLNMDPALINHARAQGVLHDREELNYFERTFVYNHSATVIDDNKCSFSFSQRPGFKCQIVVQGGRARLFSEQDGANWCVRSAFVRGTENMLAFPLSKNVSEAYAVVCNTAKKPVAWGKRNIL